MAILEITEKNLKQEITDKILHTLPEWFELEEGIQDYVRNVIKYPFFVYEAKGQQIGFVSLKPISHKRLEIYVMAILPNYHRKGVGTKLIDRCKQYMIENKYEEILVKTLSDKSNDIHYKQTREFYISQGFKIFKESNEWGESNPCVILKYSE